MSSEYAGRLAGSASAALALTALIYSSLGDVDVAGEVARWTGPVSPSYQTFD